MPPDGRSFRSLKGMNLRIAGPDRIGDRVVRKCPHGGEKLSIEYSSIESVWARIFRIATIIEQVWHEDQADIKIAAGDLRNEAKTDRIGRNEKRFSTGDCSSTLSYDGSFRSRDFRENSPDTADRASYAEVRLLNRPGMLSEFDSELIESLPGSLKCCSW
jgi:hypothetical protein